LPVGDGNYLEERFIELQVVYASAKPFISNAASALNQPGHTAILIFLALRSSMKGRLVGFVSVLIMAFGCGGEKQTIISPTTGGGSGSGGTGGVDTGGDGGTGVDVVCENALDDPGYGGYAFTSLSYTVPEQAGCPPTSAVGGTYSFSCTLCPGGLPGINGLYKYYEGDAVDTPSPSEWKETIEFKGNFWTNTIEGIDSLDKKKKTVVTTGYYFCADPDAIKGIKYKDFWNTVWVYLTVDSSSADPFGINVGATDLTFFGSSTAAGFDDIMVGPNQCWDTGGSWQNTHQYCKVGSKLFGRECKNPFE
jgi:hypothetical protein